MGLYGFPKQKRLLKSGDYRRVFDGCIVKASCPELLFLAITTDKPSSRIGFIISKKNVKHAVQRNLIKRIVREEFRQHPLSMPAKDIVVLARKGADQLSRKSLHSIARKMFKKLDRRVDELLQTKKPQESGK